MRLTDIMSSAGLSIFPQIGLVIFLLVFGCVVARVYGRRRSDEMDRCAGLVLHDDAPIVPAPSRSTTR